MSTAAASHLSPAFPERAAWGTASKLRAWQAGGARAVPARSTPRDFLAVATPGAGKTTYRAARSPPSCSTAADLGRVTVVAPTEHLKTQWAEAAARVGIRIDPTFTQRRRAGTASEFDGVAVTYAQVASQARSLHRIRTEAAPHAGDPRRGAPRRRRAVAGATPCARRSSPPPGGWR